MNFEIILACDLYGGLGSNTNYKKIPWNISSDLNFFREITTTVPSTENSNDNSKRYINAIIMGRNTADTFTNPLSDRINIVITSIKNYRTESGFLSYSSLDAALESLKTQSCVLFEPTLYKVYVIGGGILAESAINNRFCRGVYLTIINHEYNCSVRLSKNFLNVLGNINSKKFFTKTTNKITDAFCKNLNKYVQIVYCKYTYNNIEEDAYLDLLQKILNEGDFRMTRNAKTYSIFGEKLVFDLKNGFPLLTTKQMFVRGIIEELLFFLRGDTNTKHLEDKKVMIWHANTTKEFLENNNKNLDEYDMGPMYGFQWRFFGAKYDGCNSNYNGKGIDQLKQVIDLIVKDPNSRRILMTTYNPEQAEQGVLYPCHGLITQFYVEKDNRINLQMYQRSADYILGVPYNIASYALLLMIVTELVNNHSKRTHKVDYVPGKVIMVFGDVHIYSDEKADHVETAKKQLKRRNQTYPFCDATIKKKLKTLNDLNTLETSDFVISNYVSNSPLKATIIA